MNENIPNIEVSPTPQNPTANININSSTSSNTDFLNGTETATKDALYADLFEKNPNGELIRAQKAKRSPLEIFTNIMSFIVPIILIAAVVGAVHAFMRSQESNKWAENFQFLCGYLNYDIHTDDPTYECQTATFIANDAKGRTEKLEKDIIDHLSLYIPLKVSTAAADASVESTKAKEIYSTKVNANDIITQFDNIKKSAQSSWMENIVCESLNISNNNKLAVQCSVYGGDIGANDVRQLWSSRIEAIRFLEKIGDTPKSQFILNTPPTTLSIESTEKQEKIPAIYKTKTPINISLTFIPKQPQI